MNEAVRRRAALTASKAFNECDEWPEEFGDEAEYFLNHQAGEFTVSADAGLVYVTAFEVDEQIIIVRLNLDTPDIVKGSSVDILYT